VSELTEDVEGPTLTAYELQRVDWFEELGFDLAEALVLATARDSRRQLVAVHDVRVALARGCTREQAFEIFT
jgi:hypothetical protein